MESLWVFKSSGLNWITFDYWFNFSFFLQLLGELYADKKYLEKLMDDQGMKHHMQQFQFPHLFAFLLTLIVCIPWSLILGRDGNNS